MENELAGKELFEKSLGKIERVIDFIGVRHRLNPVEREDFGSYVAFKLIENDYRRIRQFRGQSRLETYLNVVVQRLFLDFRSQQWGKWRTSARARALGKTGVLLERLLYRDGLERNEAFHVLEHHGVQLGGDEFETLLREIPHRPRQRHVAVEEVDAASDLSTLSEAERTDTAQRVEAALARVARELSAEDRLILRLRFVDGCTVREIARALHLASQPLYARLQRLLRRFRKGLDGEGLHHAEAQAVWLERIDIDVESALGSTRPLATASR